MTFYSENDSENICALKTLAGAEHSDTHNETRSFNSGSSQENPPQKRECESQKEAALGLFLSFRHWELLSALGNWQEN